MRRLHNIAELFAGDVCFVCPSTSPLYAGDRAQEMHLFDNVAKVAHSVIRGDDNLRPVDLGAIIVERDRPENFVAAPIPIEAFFIHDGYQRLMAVQLLLGALYHIAQDQEAPLADILRSRIYNGSIGPMAGFKLAPRFPAERETMTVAIVGGMRLLGPRPVTDLHEPVGGGFVTFDRLAREFVGSGSEALARLTALSAAVLEMRVSILESPRGVLLHRVVVRNTHDARWAATR